MPTVLRSGPNWLFSYAGDRDEPPHVHVERDDCEAKFWLVPPRLAYSYGFPRHEINRIQTMVEDNEQQFVESWNEFFG